MSKGIVVAFVLAALLLLSGIIYFVSREPADNNQPNPANTLNQLKIQPTFPMPDQSSTATAELSIDPKKTYIAELITSAGKMTIQLTASSTPITVNNFVTLARKNFYNNTVFHRVIRDFMIQGGDPAGNGTGGPGYNIPDEPVVGEYTRGTIAMANTGRPNSGGSQFFILHQDYPLPKTYTIFGHVTAGIETVDAIATASVSANLNSPGENSKPVNPVKIQSVVITEKP